MTHCLRAITFDLDWESLVSLRGALPRWQVEVINGNRAAWIAQHWNPEIADLFVVQAHQNVTETLGLCRFLLFCGGLSADTRKEVMKIPNLPQTPRSQAQRIDAPLLVLVPPGRANLVTAALEAGAHSCLILPIHAKDVASMLVRARAGNRPGRHTLNLERAQMEDHWRDHGGEA
jgi:hypothetical protein